MDNKKTPEIVFIIPYRDRKNHLTFFQKYIQYILEDYPQDSYEIFYVHQIDKRTFNRGAMKNIGFLAVKEKYPEDYENITFVFNDVDTLPFEKNILPYKTSTGTIKHFYGFKFALGGIFSITGKDFETLGGFPNLWGWGYEDNEIQKRANKFDIFIDRSVFFPILDDNIIHLQHGSSRMVSAVEKRRYVSKYTDGLRHIHTLLYTFNENIIEVNHFSTAFKEPEHLISHDLQKSNEPFKHINSKMKMLI
jgi:hypothetical protein